MRRWSDGHWAAILVGVGLLVRLPWAGVSGLAHDEPFTVHWAMQSPGAILGMLATENNPPLYFLLMHLWATVVPLEEFWLRMPSVVASVLTVWPLFLLGTAFSGRWVGLTATVLFIFSSHHQAFAHEVRAYALLTFLTVLAFWRLWCSAHGRGRGDVWLVVVQIALIYTHFMGWAVLGLLHLAAWTLPLLRGARWRLLRSLPWTLLAFAPYGWVFLQRVGSSVSEGTWLEPPSWEEPYNMLWRWSNAPVLVVAFLLLVIIAWVLRPRMRQVAALPLMWAALPLVGLFVLSYFVPLYLDRYLLFAAPGYALLVALASVHLLPQRPWAIPMIGCLAMAFTFQPVNRNAPDPANVAIVVAGWAPQGSGVPVLVLPHWYDLSLLWYLDRDRFVQGRDPKGEAHVLFAGDAHPQSVVLVLAPGPLSATETAVIDSLRDRHAEVEEVQADRKVNVFRFSN